MAEFPKELERAAQTRSRVERSFAQIELIVGQCIGTLDDCHALLENIHRFDLRPSFVEANQILEKLLFALGTSTLSELSLNDREIIGRVCSRIDEIAAWQGSYEARLRFEAALAVLAGGAPATPIDVSEGPLN